ncbi:hypothetical protein ACS0TY_005757 [Phlomoides rotata]
MYLVNIRNFGNSKEQTPLMLTDGTSLESSPQSVPLHQDFEKSWNYQIGFLMSSTSLGITTLILKETPTNNGAGPKKRRLRALDTIHVPSKNQKK